MNSTTERRRKKALLIVNPCAGKNRTRANLSEIVDAFPDGVFDFTIKYTTCQGDAINIARDFAREHDLVICCGGDGTLNETLCGLMTLPQRPPVGYIPHGSTNDFAASLHIPAQPMAAANAIAACAQPRRLDLGQHNGRYFAYVASFGAFTRASYSATQAAKNALGHLAYIFEGMGDLDSLRPYCCRIEADDEVFEDEYIFGAVCNSTSLGGLMKLDPNHVKMDDGKFELLLLRMPKNAVELSGLIASLTRMEYDAPGVIFRHVEHVTLTTDDIIPWSLDGEYAASQPKVEILNLHHAIELMG